MDDPETIIELDLGCTPEAAISGAVLIQTEHSTFLTFNAMRPTDKISPWGGPYMADAGIAMVEFPFCQITKFGYPNDEAWDDIPRTRDCSYGIYEVLNSKWIQELVELNRYGFPNSQIGSERHFLFLFHDSSFQCIAEDIKLELSDEPYSRNLERIHQRILTE